MTGGREGASLHQEFLQCTRTLSTKRSDKTAPSIPGTVASATTEVSESGNDASHSDDKPCACCANSSLSPAGLQAWPISCVSTPRTGSQRRGSVSSRKHKKQRGAAHYTPMIQSARPVCFRRAMPKIAAPHPRPYKRPSCCAHAASCRTCRSPCPIRRSCHQGRSMPRVHLRTLPGTALRRRGLGFQRCPRLCQCAWHQMTP